MIKRRTLAKEYCVKGWIELNGNKGKPASTVKVGDLITLHLWSHKKIIKVLIIPEKILPKRQMPALYEIIEDIEEGEHADL